MSEQQTRNREPGAYTGDGDPPVSAGLHERPLELLQHLVRFDTTNPPGAERACIEWIGDVLDAYGVDYDLYAGDPERPNLVARLEGGDAPGLMLYGHVDVVPTNDDAWTHPPFAGVVEDGFLWGRGALDMKGGVAMLVAAFCRAASEDVDLAGDLVLCVLSDEEAGGDQGARYVVENHPGAFDGVEYALGEFGGFSMDVAGERFYPIQVAEKQVCWLELTFRGQGGHGSFPNDGDAMAKLARAVDALDGTRLPVHVTPETRQMFEALAAELPWKESLFVRGLLNPTLTDTLLSAAGEDAAMLDALLHHTVNTTVVEGGGKENVVPDEVSLTLDVRILPGFDDADAIRELRDVVGDDVEIDVIRFEEGPPAADMAYFDHLAGVLEDADPGSAAIPLVMPGGTDARIFADLDIQSYGFTPMQLPADFAFTDLIHTADERIPVDAVDWGADRVYDAVVGWR